VLEESGRNLLPREGLDDCGKLRTRAFASTSSTSTPPSWVRSIESLSRAETSAVGGAKSFANAISMDSCDVGVEDVGVAPDELGLEKERGCSGNSEMTS